MEIYTIGFAGKTAAQFFEPLKQADIQQLVDVRLNNVSQLAGFTKRSDLPYFLDRILGIAYRHEPLLAPESEMLKAYRARKITWSEYEAQYRSLLAERRVDQELVRESFSDRLVMLCSEAVPEKCHRRLAAEYLQAHWHGIAVHHL